MKSNKGFTLIELMITIVIIGILASIAIPSYREYVIRGNRRAAQAAMMELVAREHQIFVANRQFADESTLALPPEVADKYDLDITLGAGPPPAFLIQLSPKGTMAGDVTLTVNSDGVKTPTGKW